VTGEKLYFNLPFQGAESEDSKDVVSSYIQHALFGPVLCHESKLLRLQATEESLYFWNLPLDVKSWFKTTGPQCELTDAIN
jgi:hypothetical protein